MSHPRSQLVVRSRRPWLRWLAVALMLGVIAATGWTSFEYGRRSAGYDSSVTDRRIEELEAEVRALEARNDSLSQRVIELERAEEVDGQTYEEVQRTVNRLQGRLADLREELAFYRNIVSPATYEPGLHIESFSLSPRAAEGHHDYSLVLMQVAKNYQRARGRVELRVEGQRDGEPAVVSLDSLTNDGEGDLAYGFKYFQALEGELRLPDAFRPERVRVRVIPRGRGEAEIEQSYAWSDLTG